MTGASSATRRADLDLTELARRCAARTGEPVRELEPLPGGASSLTYRARIGDESIVLKVAPPGLPAVDNRDVLRQARLLRLLGDGWPDGDGSSVPVPRVLFELEGDDDVPPAFAMTFVDGSSYEPIMDGERAAPPARDIRSRMLHAAEILGSLHAIDPATLGLSEEPLISPSLEVARWNRSLSTVELIDRALAEHLAAALGESAPPAAAPAIVHGDFRLGNALARGGRVLAVIDWEIWAVADPRLDLAWFLSLAESEAQPQAVWQPPGMPTVHELIEAYLRPSPDALVELSWFDAATRFKQAAITALVVKNNRRRGRPDPAVERFEPSITALLRDGLRLLDQG